MEQKMSNPPNPPAGWYADPHTPAQMRYWDGGQWSTHTAPQQMPPAEAPTAVLPQAAPPAPSSAMTVPQPPPPAPPLSSPSATPTKRPVNKLLIGGAIAAGLIVAGSVGAAVGAASGDQAADQATVTTTPVAPSEPTPTEKPAEEEAPAAATEVNAVAFRAQSNSHLDDMVKDLDDIVITVQEDGFWRLLSNSAELSFNYGQLGALDVPNSVTEPWPATLTGIDGGISALDAAIETEDGPTILAAVDGLRGLIEAARGVANSAQ